MHASAAVIRILIHTGIQSKYEQSKWCDVVLVVGCGIIMAGGRINMDRPVVEGRLRRLSWLISRWDYGNMRISQKGVC